MVWQAGVTIAALMVLYKLWQAATDEEFPGAEFPATFREARLRSYRAWYGGFCHDCWADKLGADDLRVVHVIPVEAGGRNSRANARVTCRRCAPKGRRRVSPVDAFLGRSI